MNENWKIVLSKEKLIWHIIRRLNVYYNKEDVFQDTLINLYKKLENQTIHEINGLVIENLVKDTIKKYSRQDKDEDFFERYARKKRGCI